MEKQCILIPFLKATFINLENDCYLPASFYIGSPTAEKGFSLVQHYFWTVCLLCKVLALLDYTREPAFVTKKCSIFRLL